jgi:hypothetical protein
MLQIVLGCDGSWLPLSRDPTIIWGKTWLANLDFLLKVYPAMGKDFILLADGILGSMVITRMWDKIPLRKQIAGGAW